MNAAWILVLAAKSGPLGQSGLALSLISQQASVVVGAKAGLHDAPARSKLAALLDPLPGVSFRTPATRPMSPRALKAPLLAEAPMGIAIGSRFEATPVDVNMKDADVGAVLQILSAQSGVNLILASAVSSKVSLHVKQVTLLEAIRHLCTVSGLNYLKIGSTFVIATDATLKVGYPQEYLAEHPATVPQVVERITKVYQTNYVNANQVAETLKTLFNGKDIQIVAGPSALNPTIQQSDTSHATGTSGTALEKSDQSISRTLVFFGDASLVAQALGVVTAMDQPRPQVSIAVRITDVSDQAIRDVGLNWDLPSLTVTEQPGNGFKLGKFSRQGFNFDATLKALESGNLAKLLASPNISILDGEHGFVLIGDRLSYPVVTGYSQAGSPIISKEEKNVGVYLQVAANIANDGTLTLSLYPQVSTVTGYLNLNGASYPQIATREAQTTVRIHSGETLVMGGLIRDEDVKSFESVPLLSKLPLLGELFRHRNVTKTRSQVIITITPTILLPDRP